MKKVRLVWWIVISLLLLSGCNTVPSESAASSVNKSSVAQSEASSSTSESTSFIAEPTSRYKINEHSTIESDFGYFAIDMVPDKTSLALSDICAIFPDENCFYIYFTMPEDTENNAYRAKTITINGYKYDLVFLEVNGGYQKYAVNDMRVSEDNSYEITEIDYTNENDAEDTWTYNISQVCTVALDDESLVFQQEHHYSIVLQGQLFESIYQFNKDKNVFEDLWNNVIHNTDGMDVDKRSFFYFAFKCYDRERGIHFRPDDILSLDVEYNQLSYTYEGKNKDEAKSIKPAIKEIEQTIEPDEVKVVNDSKYSNKKMYKYNTINKLTDADLSKNVGNANAKTLQTAAKSYDWAVQFGNQQGYPYKLQEVGFIFKTYDYEYTQIEDFKSINIIYRYDGETYNLKTANLIADTPVTITEKVEKATEKEIIEYDDEVTDQNSELNWFEKQAEKISRRVEPIKIYITIAAILVLFGIVIGLRISGSHKKKLRIDDSSIEEFAQSIAENFEQHFDNDEREDSKEDSKK